MSPRETYEVFVRVTDEDEKCLYLAEQWFADQPDRNEQARLLDEARSTFALLYPDAEAVDFSVEVRRLRPADRLGD